MSVVSMNEDLLRIILTNAKRSFVVTTYILTDNRGHGSKGHNVYELLNRTAALPSFDAEADMKKLTSARTTTAIEKLRILRNNLDAHHSASDAWKTRLGDISNTEMEFLIQTVYEVVSRCNAAAGFDRLTVDALRKRTCVYADRLLRALAKQLHDGSVGKEFVSVNDWEQGARYDTPEDLEAWQQKQTGHPDSKPASV